MFNSYKWPMIFIYDELDLAVVVLLLWRVARPLRFFFLVGQRPLRFESASSVGLMPTLNYLIREFYVCEKIT